METNNKFRKVDYKIRSNHTCRVCGRPLKENLVKKQLLNHNGIPICYICHKLSNGITTRTVAKTGKTISFKDIQNDNIKHYKHGN